MCVEIDGSYGEGGGQIIRTAVALSAVTGRPVRIEKIRANRPNPGLAAQHLNAVDAVRRICDAEVKGLKLRSTTLEFSPSEIRGGRFEINIGTAGSITLLLQCLIPAALFAEEVTSLRIIGGTDVAWSPPFDFYKNVFLRALREMGCEVSLKLLRRGYYPKGGGVVEAYIEPMSNGLKGFVLTELEGGRRSNEVKGVSHCGSLPRHVAERQARAAARALERSGYAADIEVETAETACPGSGITLWQDFKAGSSLGERGKRAEAVGEEAAAAILSELESAATVDVHLADQLVPYMALAAADGEASEIRVREVTKHLDTNIHITQKFLDVKFTVEKLDDTFAVRCEP